MKELINYSKQPINTEGMPYNHNFQELKAYFKNQVTEETLILWMNNISECSRKIIECKFGLIGDSKPCKSFKDLNEMLGIENSKEALESAIKELEEIKYILVLADSEKFNKNFAIGLGRFAYAIDITERNRDLIGEQILMEFKGLSVAEVSALFYRFGISADGETHTQFDTAQQFGYKSGEFTRTLEYKIGRHFRHPAVRRRISVYYSTLYKEQLEKERLERIEKEKYPEKYLPLFVLREQNEFPYPINDAIRHGNENFEYIYQVASSNPEEIAKAFRLPLDKAEILCIAARSFDYSRYFKLSTVLKKDLKSFNFSSKAEELLRRLLVYTTGDLLALTKEKVSERPYIRKEVKDEILNAKENFIKTFSFDWTIDDLSLAEKTLATLEKNHVRTLQDVLNISEDTISQMKGITIAVRRDINSVKECFGYELI